PEADLLVEVALDVEEAVAAGQAGLEHARGAHGVRDLELRRGPAMRASRRAAQIGDGLAAAGRTRQRDLGRGHGADCSPAALSRAVTGDGPRKHATARAWSAIDAKRLCRLDFTPENAGACALQPCGWRRSCGAGGCDEA